MKKYLGILLALSFSYSLWAGATFSRSKDWVDQEVLTAADLNAEFNNILNNLDPAGVDDYSLTLSQMQTTVDPYPAAVESLATDLKGEIERLRYQVLQLKKSIQTTDSTYWYQDTPTPGYFDINGSTVYVTGTAVLSGPNTTISGQLALTNTLIFVNRTGVYYTGLRAATYTQIPFNNEIIDRRSEFSSNSFTVTQDGYYSIEAQIQFKINMSANDPFWAILRILKNGSKLMAISDARMFVGSASGNSQGLATAHITGIFYLVIGDVITLDARAAPDLLVGISSIDMGTGEVGSDSTLIIKRIP